MASLFDPGLLGVESPQTCSCQELLSHSNPTQYGWLRRRCRRNKLHARLKMFDWPQFYVIILDKCLYYYKNETSKKPSGAFSLYGYNRVYRSTDIKDGEVPWSFKIEHIQPGMKSFHFSASSEQEMIKWMTAIKDEMLTANNLRRTQKHYGSDALSDESMSSWGSSEYNSLETGIYNDGSFQMHRESVVSEVLDELSGSDTEFSKAYDCPLPSDLPSEAPRKPPRAASVTEEETEEIITGVENISKINEEDSGEIETQDYWAAVHYHGSKVEASEIINGLAFNGAYLVRKSEDGLNVLQAYLDGQSRKYRIHVTENGQHTLSLASGPNFDSLEDLLFHYYSKTLPHSDHCLAVPYRLHPEFINNERH